ncbi:MAG: GxxExxY protein [Phocaeicola sp.]|nr:GxxExxY protein [Phocaeicola sp.]
MEIEELIKTIIQCAYNVRIHLSAGFLESVYQKALMIELQEKGIHAEVEKPIEVYYKDKIVGDFRADIIVEDLIILELKAVQQLMPIHETQLVNYLTATHIDHGLLINFGSERIQIKRKFREYKHS